MRDLMNMMKQAKEMQAKFQAMQEEVAMLEASGTSGGGMVTVTLSGKGDMRGVKIDPSLLNGEEAEILEDLIVAAHNDAKGKIEQLMAEKTQELTAGLPIPPGISIAAIMLAVLGITFVEAWIAPAVVASGPEGAALMAMDGPMPSTQSRSGLGIRSRNWRAYVDRLST